MPRRKATKSDDSAAAETRVTRRSLRGEAPPEKTTPEEKPSPKPATKKGGGRGRPAKKVEVDEVEEEPKRGRGRPSGKAEPKSKKEEPIDEEETAEDVEEEQPTPSKPKGRGRGRGRGKKTDDAVPVGKGKRGKSTPEPKAPASRRSGRGAKKEEVEDADEPEEPVAEPEEPVAEPEEPVADDPNTVPTPEATGSKKRKRDSEDGISADEEKSPAKKTKTDTETPAETPTQEAEETEPMETDEPEPVKKSPIKIVVSEATDDVEEPEKPADAPAVPIHEDISSEEETQPQEKTAPAETATPVKEQPSPVKEAAAPAVESSVAQKHEDVSPVKEPEPSPVKEAEPSPQKASPTKAPEGAVTTPPPTEDFVIIEHKDVPSANSNEVQNAISKTKSEESMDVTTSPTLSQPTTNLETSPVADSTAVAASALTAAAASAVAVATSVVAQVTSPVKSAPEIVQTNNTNGSHHTNNINNVTHLSSAPVIAVVDGDQDTLISRSFVPNPFHHDETKPASSFSVASYNILADCHAQKSGYKFIDAEHLSLKYRHQRLLKEFEFLNSDVLCLQEVDTAYYTDVLKPALSVLGYEGHFYKRCSDSIDEGEATFYKTSRFTLKMSKPYNLKDLANKDLAISSITLETREVVSQFVNEPSVLLVTQLECNVTKKTVTVANIHVCWEKFSKPDLQCIQVATAMRELVSLAGGPNSAHIIAGDFNSWPDSAVYELMSVGYLNDKSVTSLQALEHIQLPSNETKALINIWWKGFQHTSPSMKSSYKTILGKEPHTARSNSMGKIYQLDNIWYSSHSIGIRGVLNTAADECLHAGVPNKVFPSDHLSLKAEFFLTNTTDTIQQFNSPT